MKCVNCQHELTTSQRYCAHCGQRTRDARLSFTSVITEFLQYFFNIEGPVFNTLVNLFRPGYISRQYIEGRRKSYINPIRIFAFSIIALVAFLSIDMKSDYQEQTEFIQRITEKEIARNWVNYYSTLDTTQYNCPMDDMRDRIFLSEVDSIFTLDTTGATRTDDTTSKIWFKIKGLPEFDMGQLTTRQLFLDPIDSVIIKHDTTATTLEKIVATQAVKIVRHRKGTLQYMLKYIIWVLLLATLISSVVLKLLYLFTNYRVVEHAVMLLYLHSHIVGVLLVCGLLEWLFAINVFPFLGLYIPLLILWTMKGFYQQGMLYTIFKWLVFIFLYLLVLAFSFAFFVLMSLLLFEQNSADLLGMLF